MEPGDDILPVDKILCQGRYQRYVVACMHNCPETHHCREFWAFFRERGITPVQFTNRNGIGEKVMKRIVFDCDRCGKKDIGEPWSVYRTSEPDEGRRLTAEEFHQVAAAAGPLGCPESFLASILDLLHTEHDWEHYCEPCFKKVASLAGAIVGRPVAAKPVAASSAMTAVGKALAAEPRPPARAPAPLLEAEEDEEPKPAKRGPGRPRTALRAT
jgi:hypothetical protein